MAVTKLKQILEMDQKADVTFFYNKHVFVFLYFFYFYLDIILLNWILIYKCTYLLTFKQRKKCGAKCGISKKSGKHKIEKLGAI